MTAPSIKEALELLPCPFCGGEPAITVIEPHSHKGGIADFMRDHPGSASIECGCGVGIIDADRGTVTKRWNTRAALATLQPDGIKSGPSDRTADVTVEDVHQTIFKHVFNALKNVAPDVAMSNEVWTSTEAAARALLDAFTVGRR